MPSRNLPLRITGARATKIIEEVVAQRLAQLIPAANLAYPDGLFPGQKKLPARQRLSKYVLATEAADMPLLRNPDYLELYRLQLAPLPISPFWQNLLAIGAAFKEIQKDFLRLLDNILEEEEG